MVRRIWIHEKPVNVKVKVVGAKNLYELLWAKFHAIELYSNAANSSVIIVNIINNKVFDQTLFDPTFRLFADANALFIGRSSGKRILKFPLGSKSLKVDEATGIATLIVAVEDVKEDTNG